MEVDLRSREKEKRTLRFFVRGEQQNSLIKGVPDRVELQFPSNLYYYLFANLKIFMKNNIKGQ